MPWEKYVDGGTTTYYIKATEIGFCADAIVILPDGHGAMIARQWSGLIDYTDLKNCKVGVWRFIIHKASKDPRYELGDRIIFQVDNDLPDGGPDMRVYDPKRTVSGYYPA